MTLKEYLAEGKEGQPDDDVIGVPSSWMHVGTLTIVSGSIWAGDPHLCNEEDGCIAEVPSGEYVIEAQVVDFDGIRVIGRARARLATARDISLGSEVGDTGTDSGIIGFCDMTSLDDAVSNDYDKFEEIIEGHNFGRFGVIQARMDGDIEIVYVQSGFGDGWGPVYALIADDECVGFELDFLYEDGE